MTMSKRLPSASRARFDPGLAKLRTAAVTMSGALLTYGTALLLDHFDQLSLNFVVLAVVLALTLGRVQQSARPRQRLVALVVLPVVALAASETGRLVIEHANIGDGFSRAPYAPPSGSAASAPASRGRGHWRPCRSSLA
jgi:hypothetical protein